MKIIEKVKNSLGIHKIKCKQHEKKDIYSIEVTPENAQEVSKLFYERHKKNIEGFNNLTESDITDTPLSPVEIAFMKYLEGKTPLSIASYWTHQDNINISKTIRKLLANGYVEYKKIIGANLTVAKLKELLKRKNLKTSEKKEELLERIDSVYTSEEIFSMDLPEVFCLTDKGKKIANITPLSLTHNHIFEKECLDLIKHCHIAEAYRKICLYKEKIPTMDDDELKYQLDHANDIANEYFIRATKLGDFNIEDNELRESYRSLIILSYMLGKALPTKKYIHNWIPNLTFNINEEQIKKACTTAHKKYQYFNYPAFSNNMDYFDRWFLEAEKAYNFDILEKYEASIPIYENLIAESCNIPAVYSNLKKIYKKYGINEDFKRIDERLHKLEEFIEKAE